MVPCSVVRGHVAIDQKISLGSIDSIIHPPICFFSESVGFLSLLSPCVFRFVARNIYSFDPSTTLISVGCATAERLLYFADITWNREFAGVLERSKKTGGLGADFSCFDLTRLASEERPADDDGDVAATPDGDDGTSHDEELGVTSHATSPIPLQRPDQPLSYLPPSPHLYRAATSGHKRVSFRP